MMRSLDLETMDLDELWRLHEELTKVLSKRITAEKLELEKRLAHLSRPETIGEVGRDFNETAAERAPRRKYPKVLPKYSNPSAPNETWAGRGKKPRWLVTALDSGRKLEDFKIRETDRTSERKNERHNRNS